MDVTQPELSALPRDRWERQALHMAGSPRRRFWVWLCGSLAIGAVALDLAASLLGWNAAAGGQLSQLGLILFLVGLWQWEGMVLYRLLLRLARERRSG